MNFSSYLTLLFYRVWKSLSWNYIKKSPSSNNNFVTVIYFGNWACRGFLFYTANCCSAVYSVCISKTKCWEMVCFIFVFGGYDNCISWFSCFNADKRSLTILYSSNRSKFRHSNTNEFLANYSQNPEQKFGCTICRKSRTSRVHILYSRVDLACQYGR